MKIWILLLAFLLTACNTITIRTDSAPAPVDPSINQTRLEFSGCGVDSQVGTIACLPGDLLSIVTEFPGDVIYFSADQDCSIREQVRATIPKTALKFPATLPKICDVTILYVPEYLPQGKPTVQIYGMFGEVSLQPDSAYLPRGNFSLAVDQTLSLKFEGAARGVYIGRQMKDPVNFQGDQLTYRPTVIATDLLQVKLFMLDGTIQKYVIPGNYFSSSALDVLVDVATLDTVTTLTFPQEVSVVTRAGKLPSSVLKFTLPKAFSGYVRAYTVKGRSIVMSFEKGVLQWKQ